MMGRLRESWFDGVKDSTDLFGQLVVKTIDLPPRRTKLSSLLASRCTALVAELFLGQPLAGTVGYSGHGSLLVRDAAPGQYLPSARRPTSGKPQKTAKVELIGLILATQYESLAAIRFRGWMGISLLLLASLCIGWFCGRSDTPTRIAMAMTTATRNAAVALAIVTSNFAGTPAVTAVVAYGLMSTVGLSVPCSLASSG